MIGSEIDPVVQELETAKRAFDEARAARKSYRNYKQPFLDELDSFRRSFWSLLYPCASSGTLKGHTDAAIEAAAAQGYYEKLDELNQEVAPMQKHYAALKATERETEQAWERLRWEFGKVSKAVKHRAGTPKRQGQLF